MGVDLTLIPVEFDGGTWGFGHTLLELGGDYPEGIEALPTRDPPRKFSTFRGRHGCEERGYGETDVTPYGEPLRCVLAGDLARMTVHEPGARLRAALAYVAALDPSQRVALFWH